MADIYHLGAVVKNLYGRGITKIFLFPFGLRSSIGLSDYAFWKSTCKLSLQNDQYELESLKAYDGISLI